MLFDKLRSQLNLAETDIITKDAKITQLEADLARTIRSLKDFHQRMVKLDAFAKFQTSTLQELVDSKIREQSNRIAVMTETFKEALMLSNKTYFLEAMSKQKAIKKNLKKDLGVYENKVKVLQNTIKSLEIQNKQLQNSNAQLIK